MRKDPRKKRQTLAHSSDEWVADTYTGSVCVERESLSRQRKWAMNLDTFNSETMRTE